MTGPANLDPMTFYDRRGGGAERLGRGREISFCAISIIYFLLHFSGYKYFNEIDPITQDRIGTLLKQRIHARGGWRQIAFKYGMDQLSIRSLQDDPEAGTKTLEYVLSLNPCLTVYEFCKTLKDSVGRFDIVKELLSHLSVPCSSTAHV